MDFDLGALFCKVVYEILYVHTIIDVILPEQVNRGSIL